MNMHKKYIREHKFIMRQPRVTRYLVRIQHKKYPDVTDVVHHGSSIKRKCCRNDKTNDNSFLNIIDVNSTIQVVWLISYRFVVKSIKMCFILSDG